MKALLLDMDGVLVDDRGSYLRALAGVAESCLKRSVSEEEIRAVKCQPGCGNDWVALERLLNGEGFCPDPAEIRRCFQEQLWGCSRLMEQERWVFPDSVLSALAGRFPLGIVTARPRWEAWWSLVYWHKRAFFPVVVHAESTPAPKPDPSGPRKALEALDCREGWFLGDSPDDMRAARGAGLVALGWCPEGGDPRKAEALYRAGANRVLAGMEELMEELR